MVRAQAIVQWNSMGEMDGVDRAGEVLPAQGTFNRARIELNVDDIVYKYNRCLSCSVSALSWLDPPPLMRFQIPWAIAFSNSSASFRRCLSIDFWSTEL